VMENAKYTKKMAHLHSYKSHSLFYKCVG
jgi:hypothetical protein